MYHFTFFPALHNFFGFSHNISLKCLEVPINMVPFKLFCQSFSCQVCSNSKKLVFSSIQFQSESDNGYFDCKVLSRQHALLLYEDGKFFLMDTASSNGTFVNNIRYLNINSFIRPKFTYCTICIFDMTGSASPWRNQR